MAYLRGCLWTIWGQNCGLFLGIVWVEVVDCFMACFGYVLWLVSRPLYGLFMDFYVGISYATFGLEN